MTCPSCSSPVLLGAATCQCGFKLGRERFGPHDLSWEEALRAYWRVYWPAQLLTAIAYLRFIRFRGDIVYRFQPSSNVLFVLQMVLFAIGLFLFVSRLYDPFEKFSLVLVDGNAVAMPRRLELSQRARIWIFLYWRQIAAGFIVVLLSAALNTLFGLIGLRAVYGLNPAFLVSLPAGILMIGPILMKMLIAHTFPGFHMEVRRK